MLSVDNIVRGSIACSVLFASMLFPAFSHAQLFGDRNVGSPLTARPGGSGSQNAGILNGNERFLRGNRSRRDFVGSDRNEADGFVGSSQAIAVGRVPAATESLRIEETNTARINRPVPPLPAKAMYYPRLEIDFDTLPRANSELVTEATDRLRERVKKTAGENVTLSIDGRTARLSGTAPTTKAAAMAAILASFEPGIDKVENELQVVEIRTR